MSIQVQKDEFGITTITLDRPATHNAMNPDMISSLQGHFEQVSKDNSSRAVIMKGAGKSFCAGADLDWMKSTIDASFKESEKDSKLLADMFETIYECPVPVIALIHGNVFGGGLGLIATCDVVACYGPTTFCFSEVKLGLVPSIISLYVSSKVPDGQLRPYMLTARRFSEQDAQTMGLVHFNGSEKEAEKFVDDQIDLVLKNGPEATQKTKQLLRDLKSLQWSNAREHTITTIAKQRRSEEGQEGMRAFLEKRKPSWRSK